MSVVIWNKFSKQRMFFILGEGEAAGVGGHSSSAEARQVV